MQMMAILWLLSVTETFALSYLTPYNGMNARFEGGTGHDISTKA
jgi:hypothetical protein